MKNAIKKKTIYESDQLLVSKFVEPEGRVTLEVCRKPFRRRMCLNNSLHLLPEKDGTIAIIPCGDYVVEVISGVVYLLTKATRRKWQKASADAKKRRGGS